VEGADAGFERAERDLGDRARGKPLLAERRRAIILAGEHAFVEQGPAARPMVLLLGRRGRLGDQHEILDQGAADPPAASAPSGSHNPGS
jgi:hypothetical protein